MNIRASTFTKPSAPSRLGRFINKLLGRSDIAFGGSTYMRRWRIIHTKWFGIRLHHIVRSDADRELHCHPFTFLSFILKGGYTEETVDGRRTEYKPGQFLLRSADVLHKLTLNADDDGNEIGAWTIVFRGPMRRRWGFLTDEGWVDAANFDRYKEAKANRGETVAAFATEVNS